MSKASQLIDQIWDAKNLVNATDSTSEIARKHKLFSAITEAISKDKLQRGRDFGGTEEDSIYNDLNECEEILYERAILHHDRKAMDYIQDNHVNGVWWMTQKLAVARTVLEELESLVPNQAAMALDPMIQKLKTIVPDDYPENEDSEDV